MWKQIIKGRDADFNEQTDYGGILDPKTIENWPETCVLRLKFIQTILLGENFVKEIPSRGVYIKGAWIDTQLDLSHGVIGYPLSFDNSRFERKVNLMDVKANAFISLQGSVFIARLIMERIHVKGALFLRDNAQFCDVNLIGARVGGQISIGGVVKGVLNMEGLRIEKA